MEMKTPIINGVMFNLSWLAIVYSQSNVLALGIVITHVIVHMRIMGQGRREWILLGGVFLFGMLLDQVLFLGNVLNLSGQPGIAPLWLGCLWLAMATTLMHALAMLQQKLWLAAVLGAVGGCASYIAGTRLSIVEFGWPLLSPVIIALLWALLLPLLLVAARALQDTAQEETC
jgi:hypothetical protein